MGDFADDALNEAMDAEDERLEFRLGKMSHEEAYERGIIDEFGAEISPDKPVEERPCSFLVTDSDLDAPDGAIVDGYERHGGTWEECQHEKVFAPYILTSNPPQYPWICRKCGYRSVDKGNITIDVNEYARLCQKFGIKNER